MGGRLTAVVVAAVGVLVVVGVVDAVRGGDDSPGPPADSMTTEPETATGPRTPDRRLADQGIGGLLYAALRRGATCRVEVIALPTLTRSGLFATAPCSIRVSPTGLVAAGLPCAGQSDGVVKAETGVGVRNLRGCSPAWRLNGRLTFVDESGDVVELVEPCGSVRPCLRVVVPRRRIAEPPRDIAWLDSDLLGMLTGPMLAVYDDGRLVADEPVTRTVHDRLRDAVLVGGDRFLVSETGTGEAIAFDETGRLVAAPALPPSLADGRTYAVSPDGRWAASTFGDVVKVYPAADPDPPDPITLEINAEDLDWFGG